MSNVRELGGNFVNFFGGLRFWAGDPTPSDMWRGFREKGLAVSPTTVSNWTRGKALPSDRFKAPLMEIFELSKVEFEDLIEGSKNSVRSQIIGALVVNVLSGPPLKIDEAAQLNDLIQEHTEQPSPQLKLF